MKKRVLPLLLSLALCVGLISTSAMAYSFTDSDSGKEIQASADPVGTVQTFGAPMGEGAFYDAYVFPAGTVITLPDPWTSVRRISYGPYSGEDWYYNDVTDEFEPRSFSTQYGFDLSDLTPSTTYEPGEVTLTNNSFTVEAGVLYHMSAVLLILGEGAPSASAAPSAPAAPVVPADATTYTARLYDTWGLLALNNYGTYGVWKQLMSANPGVKLAKDAVVVLPAALSETARIAPAAAGEGEALYTVKAGDTLGAIARTTYGDVTRYKAIFERNSDRLKDANTIYEGQVIVLPAK